MEKYRFKETEAKELADFLLPMLEWDPQKRPTAQEMLSHPWLSILESYDTKLREKDYKHMMLLKSLTDNENKGVPVGGDGKLLLTYTLDEESNADIEDNDEGDTSEDECAYVNTDKYGPNSPLLNVDHGPNPQFVNPQ